MDRATAELVLASLHVQTTPERTEALRNAAEGSRSWEGLIPTLEEHGVLPLFIRNLEAAGLKLPAALAPTIKARVEGQLDDHQRSRMTLQRLLASASRRGVEVTLVGGTALCFDLYDTPMRRLGELELWIAPEHAAAFRVAAEEAGLLASEEALPAWWHRRTGTAWRLEPTSPFLGPVRPRTRLHHPSMLLTVRETAIVARRRRQAYEGHPLFLLDPLDALLEVATSIAVEAGEHHLTTGRRHLLAAAAAGSHALRLDRLVDVRTWIEARSRGFPVADVLERAREWHAEPALRAVLECLQMGLGFVPEARTWVHDVARALARALPSSAGSAEPALFRPDPIERLPQWLRPTDPWLERSGLVRQPASPADLVRARVRHLAGVLGAGAVAGLCFPAALLARRLERQARQRAWERARTRGAQGSEDLSRAWRAARSVEQLEPALPSSIELPTEEESVSRFPDHYDG